VSSRNWFEGSQVSKARPGAPFAYFRRWVLVRESRSLFPAQCALSEKTCGFFGEVGHGEIGSGSANGDERFQDGALPV
jgi:hypothetical protein